MELNFSDPDPAFVIDGKRVIGYVDVQAKLRGGWHKVLGNI